MAFEGAEGGRAVRVTSPKAPSRFRELKFNLSAVRLAADAAMNTRPFYASDDPRCHKRLCASSGGSSAEGEGEGGARHCPSKAKRPDCAQAAWLPRASQAPAALTRRATMCAVVGGSEDLLRARYGAQIDAADAVFRVNDAPSRGFELHVGSKSTHRIVNDIGVKVRHAL